MNFERSQFLPVNKQDMADRGWEDYDFLYVVGDAYVDHPSFGAAIISRVLESEGFRIAILAQPNWRNNTDFERFGRPKLGVLISAGNVDSMVAHYTTSKKRRHNDCYSPNNEHGARPDRATIVYSNKIREVYGNIPIIIGGLEASLRRFAHFDYWEDKVRRSILLDSQADLISYGMGERSIVEIATKLREGTPISEITDVRGTCFVGTSPEILAYPWVECDPFEKVSSDKDSYATTNLLQYDEHDVVTGRALAQKHGNRYVLCNPPSLPLTTAEFDRVAELPYVREPHPDYENGIVAIEEVRFSVIHNRGCFGACHFCSLAFHQGRVISVRSHQSLVREVTALTNHHGFKGYIHDVGGPTANFRAPSCKKQLKHGMCKHRDCLAPKPCPNLECDHTDYLLLLRKLRKIPKIKKIFIRSGIRFDYLMEDKSGEFFAELVEHHISGQLKVAPEHCVGSTLDCMGKPHIGVYEKFRDKYEKLNKRYGKEQYLVPYLMSSHPSCTLEDGIALAEWLSKTGHMPQQVQDFYPTPGTLSTCMWYTERDPHTLKPMFVPKTPKEKAMQRALMQWRLPKNRPIVKAALIEGGREDLIGSHKGALLNVGKYQGKSGGQSQTKSGTGKNSGSNGGNRSSQNKTKNKNSPKNESKTKSKSSRNSAPPQRKAGWAKPKQARKKP
ncbi:MAG: YgiQ family radical SAM protein [Eubacteriales bacterium]